MRCSRQLESGAESQTQVSCSSSTFSSCSSSSYSTSSFVVTTTLFTCTTKPDDVTLVDHVLRFTSVCFCCDPRGRSEEEKGAEQGEEVKIVAVDLQAMAPLPGVTQIQGDITKVAG